MSEDSSIIEITFSADLKKINEISSLNFCGINSSIFEANKYLLKYQFWKK